MRRPCTAFACSRARSIRASNKNFRTVQSRGAMSRPPNDQKGNSMKKFLLGSAALAALLVAAPFAATAATDQQKKDAEAIVDKNAQTIWDIGDSIYYFGEMGMQEFESTKLLKDTMEAAGFKVELGGAGMPTNFWATYGSGHPYIVIESEID